ncbi:TPA: hypothetical protein ACPY7G_003112 [Morganella morganii]|uniref:hypothetical protein n=1 Tax=Morganella morganii TaxID=582 RepID=UPI00195C4327|nr:hypothetical protein [Morganella morganii]MBM7211588.1 hypothetical protein [Morganella morganii]MBN4016983.1 hypothetical protein [Morganella morganii]MDF5912049.1 hypothetical protein [Morganella morganii]QSB61421.1 hypothetical protein JW291_13895 [Morganella morganii]QSB89218.1 hypothetical protein JW297_11945 [Morganella morganii]
MSHQEDEYEVDAYDDPLIKAIHHVDDGRDYAQRIIHDMRQRYYIRAGIYLPRPPAPQVVAPKLIPVKTGKKRKKKVRKVSHEQTI